MSEKAIFSEILDEVYSNICVFNCYWADIQYQYQIRTDKGKSNSLTHQQASSQILSSRFSPVLQSNYRNHFALYLLREPPPSPPGRAPRPGSSSSSARAWRGSTATCLRVAPPCSPTGTGTATPPTSRCETTARLGRSAR